MANNMSLGLVIGGAVSSTVGAAFKDVESRVKKLSEQGKKARVLQSTIGETMRLRDEWRKAHAAGEKGAQALLNRLERNLGVLRKEGVEVGRLAKEYDRLGRAGRSAELKVKGHNQISQGKQQVKAGLAQGVVATGLVAATSKVSADYQAIIRDIAIKAGVARSAQEADMSRSIIATSNDIGMGRNEVADVVNQLVGAGMELKQAMEFAPVAAKFVVGQGSSGVDTAKMIQALQSNANITDPKVLEKALEAVAFQGQAGSFEASDMARWFPQLLAGMQKQGITGMDAVTQLGSMLQVQMKTAGTADEAANNLKNWIEKIGSGEVVKAYNKAGIDYQGSLNTGIQGGQSTLEASFALAKRYIEATDPEIRQLLAEYLRDAGYQTSTACDGKEMHRRLEMNVIDLIVLDLMLPGEDGLSLCRTLRVTSNIPVIMLTARGSLIDRIVGLEIGADDYLPKPFDPRELLVRIKVVLRRAQSFPERARVDEAPFVRFDQWRLDTRARGNSAPDAKPP